MPRASDKVWTWLSRINTAFSLLEKWHWISAAILMGVWWVTAWLSQFHPLWIVLGGVTLFVVILVGFEIAVLRRSRKQANKSQSAEIPICRAIEYVMLKIDDCDSDKCYPRARQALREAAFNKKIEMSGKRELTNGHHSRLRTKIPADFWDDQELAPVSTSEEYMHWEHTQAELGAGFEQLGKDREKYWDIRVNETEIKALWP